MKALSGFAAIGSIVGSGIAGWKISLRRGEDPTAMPSFNSRGKYLWRGAWVGGFLNFIATFALWMTLSLFPISAGTLSAMEAFSMSTLIAFTLVPVGAGVGLVFGLLWWSLDSVRRANHADNAPTEQNAVPGAAPLMTDAEVSEVSHSLPTNLGYANRGASTGDPIWDEFHQTSAIDRTP